MRAVVVGCGTWGTVFAGLLRDRGHEVELACRDAEQAAAIRETGRNPRYATTVDLTGIERGHRLRTGGRLASLCLAGGHIKAPITGLLVLRSRSPATLGGRAASAHEFVVGRTIAPRRPL